VPRRRPSRSRLAPRGLLLIALGVALALGGCASAPVAPSRQPISPEAEVARSLLERRRREFSDLRTQAEIRMRRGRTTQRLGGVLLLRAPASLRFEALSPFGTPVIIVAGDGRSLTLWEVLDERAYILPASPESTRRFLGLALGSEDMVAVLAGRVRPLPDPLTAELMPADELGPSIRFTGPRGEQRIWYDPASGHARQVEWREGSTAGRASFSLSAEGVPATVTLATLDGQLEAVLRYQTPKLNTGFDPNLVKVTVPEHVRIQDFR